MGDTIEIQDIETIAAETLSVLDGGCQIAPLTGRYPGFAMADAYRVSAAQRHLRLNRGERVVGRKLGFTNRNLWPQFGVTAPIYGDLYDTTCREIGTDEATFALACIREPKIEPEIAFGIARVPDPAMDETALMGCVGWVAHGIEVVQSLYPGWQFKAPDTSAAFAMHGGYLLGPKVEVKKGEEAAWRDKLADFHITLTSNDGASDRGHCSDVLGSPLTALKHLVRLLADDPDNPQLTPGEFVTTGTVTKVFDLKPGQVWTTRVEGLPLPGLRLRLTD